MSALNSGGRCFSVGRSACSQLASEAVFNIHVQAFVTMQALVAHSCDFILFCGMREGLDSNSTRGFDL